MMDGFWRVRLQKVSKDDELLRTHSCQAQGQYTVITASERYQARHAMGHIAVSPIDHCCFWPSSMLSYLSPPTTRNFSRA